MNSVIFLPIIYFVKAELKILKRNKDQFKNASKGLLVELWYGLMKANSVAIDLGLCY